MGKRQGKKSFAQDMADDFGRQLLEDSLQDDPVILTPAKTKSKRAANKEQEAEKPKAKAPRKSTKQTDKETSKAAAKPRKQRATPNKKTTSRSPRKKRLPDLLSQIDLLEEELNASEEKKKSASSQRKSFSNDLESFFQESVGEMQSLASAELSHMKKQIDSRQKSKAPVGIEALLQRTLQGQEKEELSLQTARLTLVLDKEKVERLKLIARQEQLALKDLVGELLERYIQEKKNN